MSNKAIATDVAPILQTMLAKDNFSQWMGLQVTEYREGYCQLQFTITDTMLNGFGIVHGGILFAAADSAFAFACNSHGRLSVALDAQISFIKPAKADDTVVVTATEVHTGNRTSFYNIVIFLQNGIIIATFKGTAFRTDKMVVEPAISSDE